MAVKEPRGIRLAGVSLVWAGLALALGGAAGALIRYEQRAPGAELFKDAEGAALEPAYQAAVSLHGGLMTLAPTIAVTAAALGLVVARGGWRRWLLWPGRVLLGLALFVGLASLATGLLPLKTDPAPWLVRLEWLLGLSWQYIYVAAPFLLIAAGVATAPATRTIGVVIRNVLALVSLFIGLHWLYRALVRELSLGGPEDSWREFVLASGAGDGRLVLAFLALLMGFAVLTRRGWLRDAAAPYAFVGGLLVAALWVVLLPDLAIFQDPLLELAPIHSIYGALLSFVAYGVAWQWVRATGRSGSAGLSWLHALLLAAAMFAMSAPWAMLGEYGMPRRTMDFPEDLIWWADQALTMSAAVVALQAIGLLRLIIAAWRRPEVESGEAPPATARPSSGEAASPA